MRIFAIFLVYFVICSPELNSQTLCPETEINFTTGETLEYTVSYNWFVIWTDVGYVNFKVSKAKIGEKPYLHLLATGQTTTAWDIFFKVRDRYESWVAPLTLKPVYFKRRVREGGYEIDIRYIFNRRKNYALSSYIVNKKPEVKDTIAITDCTFDIMSVLYYARTLDYTGLKQGQTIPFIILLDRQLENVYFRYLGTERIRVKQLGEVECLKLAVSVVAGSVFKEGGESLTLWITNDRNKVPVYLESSIIVGSVKVRLSSYSNLRYPADAFLK
ncbi:MAG: DUF3108 domain-containing protein [Bacteroidales bacterium]|nr:DUF3108 domain-containing protein [Bacteroidales bacterium]